MIWHFIFQINFQKQLKIGSTSHSLSSLLAWVSRELSSSLEFLLKNFSRTEEVFGSGKSFLAPQILPKQDVSRLLTNYLRNAEITFLNAVKMQNVNITYRLVC